MNISEIESLTRAYAEARGKLSDLVGALQAEIEGAKRRRIAAIRRAVGAAAESHAALRSALDAAPGLFAKPKTVTFAGVRVGYIKQRGQVVMDDEEAVIRRIREQLPTDQAALLIRVRESVHKPSVYDLTAGDLKRLGIRVEDDEDVVVIKPVDGEVDKLVDAMLRDAEHITEEAA
jgi:hypothetical protein